MLLKKVATKLITTLATVLLFGQLALFSSFGAAGNNFLKTTDGGADDKSSVVQTTDGGYIVTGSTYEKSGPDHFDVMLAKYSASGNLAWTKTVGWANNDSAGYSIQQTTDGGYIVTGLYDTYTRVAGTPYYDLLLVKFDSSGNVTWAKTIGESGTRDDVGYSVRQTSDGGYIVTGRTKWSPGTTDDLLLVKFDSSGNVTWVKRAGINSWSDGSSIQQTSDGGYIVAGYTQAYGAGSADILIVKFDSGGNITWTKTIGKTLYDLAGSIQQTSDGGYIVSGTVRDSTSNNNLFLGKLDSGGNLSWSKTVGGSGSDRGRSVVQTTDGGYIVSGSTNSFGAGATDLFLVKFDAIGNVTWAKTAGTSDYDEGFSVQQTTDGGYVSVGYTYNVSSSTSKLLMVKTDSSGNIAGCSQLQNASPTEYSAPTVGSQSLTSIIMSLSVTAQSPTVTSPTPAVNSLCEEAGASPTPSPAPPFLYLYHVSADRRTYNVWAWLENPKDPRIYTHPEAQCKTTPPLPGYNFCGAF